MPLIPFPNVPNVPGVPNIPRDPLGAITSIGAIVGNINARAQIGEPVEAVYGIFDEDGNAVIVPDTIQAFAFQSDYSLSNFPIEQGGFNTYNKVQNPFQNRVLVVKGGNDSDRAEFLATVEGVLASTQLYSIVTPETTYVGVNMVGMSLSRTNRDGANMLIIDLQFIEVRLAPAAQYNEESSSAEPISDEQTDSAQAASAESNGQVQGETTPIEDLPPLKEADIRDFPPGYTKDPASGVILDPQGRPVPDLSKRVPQ